MDSMRHLSTSLPFPTRRRNEPELLASFKSAALSVTNLFKAAAADSTHAREAGYQDALEDLLAYMDSEKIGLGDGEGWSIRRWLLQRIEDTPAVKAPGSDDGDESQREDPEARAQSAEAQKKSPEPEESAKTMDIMAATSDQQSIPDDNSTTSQQLPTSKDFTFRSTTQYPTNHDREGQNAMEIDGQSTTPSRSSKTSTKSRLVHNKREGRSQHTSVLSLNLGPATGTKRKVPYSDFFDISGITFDAPERKDPGSRGGKRARQA